MSRSNRVLGALWYAVISVLALWGMWANLDVGWIDMLFFSNLFALATGVVFAALAVAQFRGGAGRAGVVSRGACTLYGVVVAVVFNTLLDADLTRIGSLLVHALVPALLLVDWFAMPRTTKPLPPRVILPWLLLPLLYLPLYTLNGRPGEPDQPIYGFLDPQSPSYWPLLCGFIVLFVLIGLLLLGAQRLRLRAVGSARREPIVVVDRDRVSAGGGGR